MNAKQVLFLALCTLTLGAIVGCQTDNSRPRGKADIVICSKNFTEQNILGELLAQQIESQTNLTVDRQLNLGGTFLCHDGLRTGQIDAYVEYTGTAFTAILNETPISDAETVYQKVKQAYQDQFNLTVMPPLGFNNTFAIMVRGEDARNLNLKTLSDAAEHTPQWTAGFGYEFMSREDGFPGLAATYQLTFARPPEVMDLGLMYRALVYKKVDLIAGDSTNGLIDKLGLVVLEDDKNYFPPYQAVPIVRQETLEKYPELEAAITQLAGLISEAEMQQMNYQVDGEFRRYQEVVREFLASKQSPKSGNESE
ncbi:ABC transporter substrate-binding protein [Laspinema sp. D1]|uniref:ABC transporter substrate-binding protein n=1 Tax=Laspinema palackyanum D2a TaxID=2953684 RepID=A0ABT2MT30_9CYAN|nr:ABC transporter substrate-binding protein [Laspinema sp. D2a]